MADRRGPATGYDFGSKRQYRRDVYAQIRRAFNGQMSTRTCAILPSIEGAEIDVAIRAGFRERNICVIDENPAIVATLKRKYPAVRTYGVSADRAADRIRQDISSVDFVNLDLCGPIGEPLWETLRAWVRSGALGLDCSYVAVTVLRGRERGEYQQPVSVSGVFMDGAEGSVNIGNERDWLRLTKISLELAGLGHQSVGKKVQPLDVLSAQYEVSCCRTGVYRSAAGSQTMLWGIWRLHKRPCMCDDCHASFFTTFSNMAPGSADAVLAWWDLNVGVHGEDRVMHSIERSMAGSAKPSQHWKIPAFGAAWQRVIN